MQYLFHSDEPHGHPWNNNRGYIPNLSNVFMFLWHISSCVITIWQKCAEEGMVRRIKTYCWCRLIFFTSKHYNITILFAYISFSFNSCEYNDKILAWLNLGYASAVIHCSCQYCATSWQIIMLRYIQPFISHLGTHNHYVPRIYYHFNPDGI